MIDRLAEAMGAAIGDIRDKLLFEGFFGRRIADAPDRRGWDVAPANTSASGGGHLAGSGLS